MCVEHVSVVWLLLRVWVCECVGVYTGGLESDFGRSYAVCGL